MHNERPISEADMHTVMYCSQFAMLKGVVPTASHSQNEPQATHHSASLGQRSKTAQYRKHGLSDTPQASVTAGEWSSLQ